MYVHWKSLFSFGFVFWILLWWTDLLGESTWKKCSTHIDDILKGQYNGLVKMHEKNLEHHKQKINWPSILWNICAFVCSLLFCTAIKSTSWVVWRLFKIYNIFKTKKIPISKTTDQKLLLPQSAPELTARNQTNCQILFTNQMFTAANQENEKLQAQLKELEELKKEKNELVQQLDIAQKENMTARQQIEEYKLETFMMQEKLTRTANTLKENLKYKDFASASQQLITKKAHNLEVHLREVSKDRDLLRNKLNTLEKNYVKLNEKVKMYEKQPESEINGEQLPEKDVSKTRDITESEIVEGEVDICQFQKRIMALQKNGPHTKVNSKISVDLDESSLDTSKENDFEYFQEMSCDSKRNEINVIKQNILNYSAYKTQMLRPRVGKLGNIKERKFRSNNDTGSSSDENSNNPRRIISSTVEFQNFLKTLNSNSISDSNYSYF